MTLFPTGTATWGPPGDASSPYRYTLTRTWSDAPKMAVIGVNPSTATAEVDDPTIRRCIRFAADSGHGGLVMLNLFAWRSTDIRGLATSPEPLGAGNDAAILAACRDARTVVCAWGAPEKVPPDLRYRWETLPTSLWILGVDLHVLALTKGGHPGHPLYLPASCRPVRWT